MSSGGVAANQRGVIPRDGRPFILLDDAAADRATLYRDPLAIVRADRTDEVAEALASLRRATAEGRHAAGWIGYEAGYALEPRLLPLAPPPSPDRLPLLWFGLFATAHAIDDLAALLPDPAGARAVPPRPNIARQAYEAAVAELLDQIDAGEFYQANLTFQARVRVLGHPLALYARLRRAARGAWGGVVWTGSHWLLSGSPELMATLEGSALTARPMKGTARRQADPAADRAAADVLAADPKQRAENLMIVDLIRNDLARVAEPGSVAVPALHRVETYPTVHQMTSTVTARLAPGRDAVDVIEAMFPCGSVTGAPKIRAMEALAAIEQGLRGAYTGSIGRLSPDGGLALNVAIRTLVWPAGSDEATLGLGSAIVADSEPADEWAECLTKGAFVTAGQPPVDLIETMRVDPVEGVVDLERHLARMSASAVALGFPFDRHGARNELHAATFRVTTARALRMRVAPSGAAAVALGPMPAEPDGPVVVALRPLPVEPGDYRLRHKTSDRGFYDAARADAGTFEVAFVDPDGFLTEGSFTSLFVERGGRLLTPPLARGLLPGVLRARLMEEGRAEEHELTAADLAQGFLVGNALRGLIAARLA